MIPILELETQYQRIQPELEEAMLGVLRRTRYILGPEVEAFEREFADWNGCPYAIGVGSGTEALHLALRALEIGPGDEVICPAFTFAATAGAICLAGARPVFADIEGPTYSLDPARLSELVTPRTRAIIVVHLYGLSADMDPLLEFAKLHSLAVIEDCAQATGACYKGRNVGSIGDLGCFSFFPSKNLGAVGDGGAVVTRSQELGHKIRQLRQHGSQVKYWHQTVGTNSRLDELQACALRVKLRYLQEWNQRRRELASVYHDALSHLPLSLPLEPPGREHVYNQYTVRTPRRDKLAEHLHNGGVGAVVYYPQSLHLQEAFAPSEGEQKPHLPESEKAQAEVVSLPIYPELSQPDQARIAELVESFFVSSQDDSSNKASI